ncbi:hypothetical protein [Solilutibacter silvestris]|uniref:hypothetical protein n=1 Tax=Solilutibacter silvestris TaxID=1645665 RepID=UPI003D3488C0
MPTIAGIDVDAVCHVLVGHPIAESILDSSDQHAGIGTIDARLSACANAVASDIHQAIQPVFGSIGCRRQKCLARLSVARGWQATDQPIVGRDGTMRWGSLDRERGRQDVARLAGGIDQLISPPPLVGLGVITIRAECNDPGVGKIRAAGIFIRGIDLPPNRSATRNTRIGIDQRFQTRQFQFPVTESVTGSLRAGGDAPNDIHRSGDPDRWTDTGQFNIRVAENEAAIAQTDLISERGERCHRLCGRQIPGIFFFRRGGLRRGRRNCRKKCTAGERLDPGALQYIRNHPRSPRANRCPSKLN